MAALRNVSYPGFVADIKKTYSKDYLKAQHAMGVNVRDYKEWDKNDLIALYDSYFGRVIFDHLVALVLEARREEAQMRMDPSRQAFAFAQNDLGDIAPNGMDWKGYENLIMQAVTEIRAMSFKITSNLQQLFAASAAEESAPTGGFDAQTALSQLDLAMRHPMTADVTEIAAA